MGTSAANIVTLPPVYRYQAWTSGLDVLVRTWLAACPLARATTYYFATDGSDSNDGLTTSTPKQTIGAANTIISGSGGAGVRLRFKRGQTWSGTTTLTLNVANVTVDDWSTGTKPRFKYACNAYAGGWTQAGATNRWTRAEATDIAWVRHSTNYLTTILQRVTTTAAVESTLNSFYWDGATLHVNVGGDPGSNYEGIPSNSADGVVVTADGCRVRNITGDGWGCSRTVSATQKQPFTSNLTGTNLAVFDGVEGYFSGTHSLAHYSASTGGLTLWIDCKAGYTKYGASGETVFNSYAANGDNECVWINCDAVYGTLPSSDWYVAATNPRRGRAFYAHTTTGSLGLHVSHNCRISNNTYGATTGALFANLPSGTLDTAKGLVVREVIEGGDGAGSGGIFLSSTYQVNFGCDWTLKPADPGVTRALNGGTGAAGWFVCGIVRTDLSLVTGSRAAFWNGPTATDNSIHILHSRFDFTAGTQDFDFDYDRGSSNILISNCVIQKLSGSNTIGIGTNNTAAAMKSNAYYAIAGTTSRAYSNDAGKVDLVDALDDPHYPTPSSSLYQVGNTTLGVESDMSGRPIQTAAPSIGPLGHTFRGDFGPLPINYAERIAPASTREGLVLTRDTNGDPADADATPSLVVRINGALANPTVTWTHIGTGEYSYAYTAGSAGDRVAETITATVGGIEERRVRAYVVDENVSTRLPTSSYTAPDNSTISTINTKLGTPAGASIAADIAGIDAGSLTADQIAKLNAIYDQTASLGSSNVTTLSTLRNGRLELVQGDSYPSAKRPAIRFVMPTGANWPTSLSGWTPSLVLSATTSAQGTGDTSATITGSVVSATGDTREVKFEPTAAQTGALKYGTGAYEYRVVATDGTDTATLAKGPCDVIREL